MEIGCSRWAPLRAAAAPALAQGRTCVDKNKLEQEKNREVARQMAAIKAISNAEVEDILTELHLLRSYFSEEQLKMPVLQFFNENLPNVSVVRGEDEQFDLRWKDEDGNCSTYNGGCGGGRDLRVSLLHQMAMAAYPDARQSFGGYQFSAKSMMTDLPQVDDFQFGTYLSQESLNNVMLGMPEGFQTPGATSQRLSVGMTPKTLRLPKQGEMLLSVHGSPLGVYKEENMEAINEAEEG